MKKGIYRVTDSGVKHVILVGPLGVNGIYNDDGLQRVERLDNKRI